MTTARHATPRRVLMTADAVGGVWTYAVELARQFDRAGIELILATMGTRPSETHRRDLQGLRRVSVVESDFQLEWMDDPWADVQQAGEWLLDLERQTQPDIVHLNGYVHGALPWRAPPVVVAHSCKRTWWEAVRGGAPPQERDEYWQRVAAGLAAADTVVAPTSAMLTALRRHYGELPNATVIWNGRTADRFSPATKRPVVFAAGRAWDEAKNIALLDRVTPMLSWPVFVAGDTTDPSGHTVSLDNAKTLGPIAGPALAMLMAHAAIYALPARYEPFGLSVLEAALSGCALVLGDIGSLRELWDGVAMFVDPDDEAGFADTLRWLIDHAPAREALAERGRMRALGRTPESMTAGYLATYRSARGAMVA
jgi:glycogen(starch) synthase